MDRFIWLANYSDIRSDLVYSQDSIRLYDGEEKTPYDNGTMVIRSTYLEWSNKYDPECVMILELAYIKSINQIASTFTKSSKLELILQPKATHKQPGPMDRSKYDKVRLSFVGGGHSKFHLNLVETIRQFRQSASRPLPTSAATPGGQRAAAISSAGISGIENTRQNQAANTQDNIGSAFNDLADLMDKAKEMVILSQSITEKLQEKQGEVTEDETRKFKSHLLSLGIADPVTKDGSGNEYFTELGKEIAHILESPLKECGGVMSLSDIYCRINRARGTKLVSPEDVYNACKSMSSMSPSCSMGLHEYSTGVAVLQLNSVLDSTVAMETANYVESLGSVTAESFSHLVGLNILLARERLLMTERAGNICRDDHVDGLYFYPNLFNTKPPMEKMV